MTCGPEIACSFVAGARRTKRGCRLQFGAGPQSWTISIDDAEVVEAEARTSRAAWIR